MQNDQNRSAHARSASIDPRYASPPMGDTGPTSALRRALPRILGGVLLAVIVASALALFADVRSLGAALESFSWWLLVPVLGLTLVNYVLRWVKWHVYLRVVGVPRISLADSVLAFLSAFSMALTPGKVGEIIKAIHVHRLTNSPVSRVAAVIAAERITDGLAMTGLAAVGFLQFSQGRPVMAAAAVLGIGAILLFRHPSTLHTITQRLATVPVAGPLIGAVLHHIEGFLDASNALYAPKLVVGSVALGMVSWFCECVALYLILIGLGIEASWTLLLVSTFVLSVSSVLGALSMLPGGLGVAEASVAGLLLLLIDDPTFARADAAAATLLIRFATLWFGVLLGVVALPTLQRRGRPATMLAR
ncbi:MAG TPA: lysylphosphatidylglycerol synthase transmembrane domain-containing protein [Thermomicrobiales bacterium]|nr:lysylphosphatidylglycerol synthase transmembrane domain-containing protein [Thermomicrobiales bacterium]